MHQHKMAGTSEKKIRQQLENDGYRLTQLESAILDDGSTDIDVKANKVTSKL